MTVTAPHPLFGERAPSPLPMTLALCACGAALLGATGLPRIPVRDLVAAAPAPRPVVQPEAPAPALAPAPAPTPAPVPTAAIGAQNDCPPRVSVRFETASWRAPEGLSARLRGVRQALDADPRATVLVLGFADPDGSDRDNHLLSVRRAASVARALQRVGVARGRMTLRGFGALTADADVPGFAELRRVVVRVRGRAACAGAAEEVVGP